MLINTVLFTNGEYLLPVLTSLFRDEMMSSNSLILEFEKCRRLSISCNLASTVAFRVSFCTVSSFCLSRATCLISSCSRMLSVYRCSFSSCRSTMLSCFFFTFSVNWESKRITSNIQILGDRSFPIEFIQQFSAVQLEKIKLKRSTSDKIESK